jgi:hypothetical protein
MLSVCIGLYALVVVAPAAPARDAFDDERLLKTAFIFNFAKFTRWPTLVWAGPQATLNLCTVGADEVVETLGRLGDETIRGRRVAVRSFAAEGAGEGEACHVLYVAASEQGQFTRFFAQLGARPVLTVSQIPGFAAAGGMIQLYRYKDRIRFKINLGVARERNLGLSATLLDLADVIGGEGVP